jgi:uncharacterized protein YdaU (DUF1376 family)
MGHKLAWFPFFIDDWLGGTLGMSQGEIGAYLQALLQQWNSGDLQAIKDTPKALQIICRGHMSFQVRSKFISITIDGQKHLRNPRLSEVYADQKARHQRRVERAKWAAQVKHKQSICPAPSTHNPEPITHREGSSKDSGFKTIKETPSSKGLSGKPDDSPAAGDSRVVKARRIFDHWKVVFNHSRAVFGPKRRRAVEAMLKYGFTEESLKRAVDGCKCSAWHQGNNENHQVYDEFELIMRNEAKVEQFIAYLERQESGDDNGSQASGRRETASERNVREIEDGFARIKQRYGAGTDSRPDHREDPADLFAPGSKREGV